MNNSILKLSFSSENNTEPVNLAEAKLFCNIDLDDYDSLITMFIKDARISCENYANKSLITRTITAEIKSPYGEFILPYGPVNSVSEVKDIDGNDVDFTHNGVLKTVSKDYLKVVYSVTPIECKVAILNQVKNLYENKGAADLNAVSKSLLIQYRDI